MLRRPCKSKCAKTHGDGSQIIQTDTQNRKQIKNRLCFNTQSIFYSFQNGGKGGIIEYYIKVL